ncbi:MAG: chromosomal replication initiator protein DnaA [Desulfobacteraceae bacterium]|nr:chromosomal replication initiator protein DnaA [Desulfobacteraceae bacterium]
MPVNIKPVTVKKNKQPNTDKKNKQPNTESSFPNFDPCTDLSRNSVPIAGDNTGDNIWERAKASLKEHMPEHFYKMWIEPVEFNNDKNGTVTLSCPNFFSKKRVQDHYGTMIESELKKISGKNCKISIEIAEKNGNSKSKKTKKKKKQDMIPQLSLPDTKIPLIRENEKKFNGRHLRRDFTFDRFVVGNNNEFAYSASLSLASQKNSARNSLFILSNTGNGKSHLSQSIGHHILSHYPLERVSYITAEDFINEMVSALRQNSIDKFKEKYRSQCDVLILEDIHFLAGKERTQVELALSLDHLFDADKKIIFTSCYLPTDIPKMNEQLTSRFSSGLITNIEPPDFKTRVKILRKKIKENNYRVSNDVTDYLAAELSENVRQLESGLIGIAAKSSLLGKDVDLNLAESVIRNIVRQHKNITIDVIKELVCTHFNISINDIVSKSRKKAVVRPRQIAIYLSRKYTEQPLQTIGKSFNRYHATAIHSINAVEKELRADASMQKQLEFFAKKIEAGG